jgi:hypothetical protein
MTKITSKNVEMITITTLRQKTSMRTIQIQMSLPIMIRGTTNLIVINSISMIKIGRIILMSKELIYHIKLGQMIKGETITINIDQVMGQRPMSRMNKHYRAQIKEVV